MHNRFQTADNQTGATGGRVGNAARDQRRFASLSSACGAAKTRPSRGTQSRQTGGGTVFHAPRGARVVDDFVFPWDVSLKKDNGAVKAIVTAGKLYSGLLGVSELEVVIDANGYSISKDKAVCIEYTYADDTLKIVTADAPPAPPEPPEGEEPEEGEDFEPIIRGEDGEVLSSLFPLAVITEKEDSDPAVLVVNQIVKNDLTTTLICYDGEPVKYFLAI